MYVCICKAVTSVEVEAAIAEGASSVGEVTRACRAGGDCGTCHATIDWMIERRAEGQSSVVQVRVRPRAA